MRSILFIFMLCVSESILAGAGPAKKSLRFLGSAGAGLNASGKAYELHLRLHGDRIVELDSFAYGVGLEFAKSNLFESRGFDDYYYGFDYLLGLRLMYLHRMSDQYTMSLVFAAGPTRVTFSPSRIASAVAAGTEIDVNAPQTDHEVHGQYASYGVHFQREHPSLVRLSEWGLSITYYRAQFASGWVREGLHDFARAPGLMQIFLFNLHVGIGGIIDL